MERVQAAATRKRIDADCIVMLFVGMVDGRVSFVGARTFFLVFFFLAKTNTATEMSVADRNIICLLRLCTIGFTSSSHTEFTPF